MDELLERTGICEEDDVVQHLLVLCFGIFGDLWKLILSNVFTTCLSIHIPYTVEKFLDDRKSVDCLSLFFYSLLHTIILREETKKNHIDILILIKYAILFTQTLFLLLYIFTYCFYLIHFLYFYNLI